MIDPFRIILCFCLLLGCVAIADEQGANSSTNLFKAEDFKDRIRGIIPQPQPISITLWFFIPLTWAASIKGSMENRYPFSGWDILILEPTKFSAEDFSNFKSKLFDSCLVKLSVDI